jgi:pyridoxine 5'-phosphate synthase PdxJ
VIELHTGHYADTTGAEQQAEFERIKNMATYAHSIGLQVNAGHGLTLENTRAIAQLPASIWSFCASINKETTTSEALSCAQTSVILEI